MKHLLNPLEISHSYEKLSIEFDDFPMEILWFALLNSHRVTQFTNLK